MTNRSWIRMALLFATVLAAVAQLAVYCPAAVAQAQPQSLFVDASAVGGGDGSATNPYQRITDAVVAARTTRQDGQSPIIIHIAPGTYLGSYNPSNLSANPSLEPLPIILNVPELRLRGGTELIYDNQGFPMDAAPGTLTTLASDSPLGLGQTLLLVTRTNDGGVGDDVVISGFDLNAISAGTLNASSAILIDRVTGFEISGNRIERGFVGIRTRLASGAIEGNLLIDSATGTGLAISGGSATFPAKVAVRGNRATGLFEGATVAPPGQASLPIDVGTNSLILQPIQTIYDRNNAQDQQSIPDTLEATLNENDFSGNSDGVRCFLYPRFTYATLSPDQPMTGHLALVMRENFLNGNGDYGIAIDAGFTNRSNPRQFTGVVTGQFEANQLVGNGRNGAFFGFTRLQVSLGLASPQQWKYLENSTYQMSDADGELVGFDLDHPATDSFDGRVLGNTLFVNGVETPYGIKVTP